VGKKEVWVYKRGGGVCGTSVICAVVFSVSLASVIDAQRTTRAGKAYHSLKRFNRQAQAVERALDPCDGGSAGHD
jgi:hypothetical protein